jgi:hypothetical protein
MNNADRGGVIVLFVPHHINEAQKHCDKWRFYRDLDSTILFLNIDYTIGLVPLSGPDVRLYPGYPVN